MDRLTDLLTLGQESRRLVLLVDVGRASVPELREAGAALGIALHQASGIRSARKSPDPVKVVLDPTELF